MLSVVMPSIIMLSVVMVSVIALSVIMLVCHYAECCKAESQYVASRITKCHNARGSLCLSVVMLSIIKLD